MNAVASTNLTNQVWWRGAWGVVLLVTLLHTSGVVVVKYGLPDFFPKRVSEITIELGGTVLRGDGGEGVRQASKATQPTETSPAPVKPSAEDGSIKRSKEVSKPQTQTPNSASSSTESSTAAGVQAAPTIDADYKAAYLNNPKPPYPPIAFQMRIEGTVMLKAHVQPDGSCGEVLLARSSGNEQLDRSAMNTVAQWKFTPAKSQGKDISQWVSIPITFSIKRR